MTAESRQEQGSLGLDRLSEAEFARFERLNADYRARFGMPFIICVRRHTRDSILASFERRLANAPQAERAAALEEIGHITRLRLVEAVNGPGKPKTEGRLSTHVLDTVSGKPAAGVKVILKELGSSAEGVLKETITNADGRTDAPLLGGGPLRIGTYEIAFHIGAYFAAQARGGKPAAVPRRGADPLRHRRARGPLPRAPARLPLGLLHLPGELTHGTVDVHMTRASRLCAGLSSTRRARTNAASPLGEKVPRQGRMRGPSFGWTKRQSPLTSSAK